MRRLQRITLQLLCALVASAFAGFPVFSQTYPSGPVRIVVALGAGSQVDLTARLLAPKLSESWRQPVVVENRPGGAGAVAGGLLVQSPPDGHTLMMYSDGHAVNAALNAASLPYDTLRDIARVSMVASMPSVLVVSPALGVTSMEQLIALAKAKPGQLSFGSAGIGGGLHFSGELFKQAASIDTVHVPYKGTAEALADTVAGRVQFMFASPGPAIGLIRSGRLLALAVGSAQRSPVFPDVPTVSEAGLPGFEYVLWQGLFAPGRTPQPILDSINREVNRIMMLPETREQLRTQSLVYQPNTPAEFDRFVRAEIDKLTKVVRVAGIKPQ
jgi:tripartite-type tricarboxylate transporter receptor subunit TctC